MEENEFNIATDYFLANAYSRSSTSERIYQMEECFSVIDGSNHQKTILELREESPEEWCRFKWYITGLKYWFS